jgi:hypothetical protein
VRLWERPSRAAISPFVGILATLFMESTVSTAKPRPSWGRWFLLFAAIGSVASLIMLVRTRYGDPTPEITGEAFSGARRRWREAGLKDYDVSVEVINSGRLEKYDVAVRGGHAESASRNGAPLTNHRTFETWSVPGMFGTIDSDWQNVEKHLKHQADASTLQLTVKVEFDPKYGYPKRYRRIEWGSSREISWKVTRFEPHASVSQ